MNKTHCSSHHFKDFWLTYVKWDPLISHNLFHYRWFNKFLFAIMNLMLHVIINIVTWKHFYSMWVEGLFFALRPVLNLHIQGVPKLEFWTPILWPLEMVWSCTKTVKLWNCKDVSSKTVLNKALYEKI